MRNHPHIWKRFFSLKTGEVFSIGKKGYVKQNFFQARRLSLVGCSPVTVSPLRRVRTTQPIKAGNYPIKGTVTGRRITATECRESIANQPAWKEGRTHREPCECEIYPCECEIYPCECEIYQTCVRCFPLDAKPEREEEYPVTEKLAELEKETASRDRKLEERTAVADFMLDEAIQIRDSLDQDHTPEKLSENEQQRTL